MQGTKKIRVLTIWFDAEIENYEIPAFRGAIASKTSNDNMLFHNHLKNGDGFRYAYPLIQYKRIRKNPAIVCIEQGVDEIHKYFENKCWDIEISGRWLSMKLGGINMNQFVMQVWDRSFSYTISNWIALNQENYPRYLELEKESEKREMLESILRANILSFAKGIGWHIENEIRVSINEIRNARGVMLKGKKMIGFDVVFSSNVFLPNTIGLGKSVSLGFGTVRSSKNTNN